MTPGTGGVCGFLDDEVCDDTTLQNFTLVINWMIYIQTYQNEDTANMCMYVFHTGYTIYIYALYKYHEYILAMYVYSTVDMYMHLCIRDISIIST